MPSLEVHVDEVLRGEIGLGEAARSDQDPARLVANRDVAVLAGDQSSLPQAPATEHDIAGGLGAVDGWRLHSTRRKTTWPRTTVASARPRSRRPAKGVLRLLE